MYRLEEGYWWYRGLRDRIVLALDAHAPQFRSLLDAGCGTGGVLHRLRELRPEARLVGIDASPFALRRSRTRGCRLLAQASVNDVGFRSGTFQVVTCNDVLYFRGIDDQRAVAELARVLAPGGILVLNLPAFEFLRGAHDEFVSGQRRYTRRDVVRLVSEAGLRVARVTYWNAALFPVVAVVRKLRKAREHTVESDLRPISTTLNRVLYTLLRVEAAWLRHGSLPFGTSVLCVARKPAAHPRLDETSR